MEYEQKKKVGWVITLVGLITTMGACTPSAGATELIQPQMAAERLQATEKPLLIDVRTRREYATGYIAGAKLIPVHELQSRMSELDAYKNKPIIVYCHSGRRSAEAAKMMEAAGFTKVADVHGGISNWQRSGLPIKR